MRAQGENEQIATRKAGVICTEWLLLSSYEPSPTTSMNRKLLCAGLVLINFMPFIYGFVGGYSLWKPFVNLFAFVTGQEYDAGLFLLVLMALLLSVALVITSASATTSSNVKNHVILHPSDGRQIAEENQQKVLQLQQLLKEVKEGEQEHSPKAKKLPADSGLDMNII